MFKFKIIAFFFCLLALDGLSQNLKPVSDPDKVLAILKKSSDATNSIQADFQEEKILAILKEPQKSSGTFYYQKSNKMRWEQKSPVKYVILINGDRLRIQEAGKEKNVGQVGRMASQIKELLMGLVNGDFQNNKAFKQTLAESSIYYQVTLVPVNKRLKNIYSKIDLLFTKNTARLKELTFYQKDGDKSVMKFSNEKVNQPIADSVFRDL